MGVCDDLISRQAALEAIGEKPFVQIESQEDIDYEQGLQNQWQRDTDRIKLLQPTQRWIPVSERLPEVNTRCLCTYEHKEGTCIDFGLYMKNGWFVSGVTAWIPLPEPYKKEESDDEVH